MFAIINDENNVISDIEVEKIENFFACHSYLLTKFFEKLYKTEKINKK